MAETPQTSRETDDEVTKALQRYRLAEERERENQLHAYEDLEFLAGDQWPADLAKDRAAEGRPVLQFNRMPQFVRQVVNDIRLMRPSIKVVGVDDKTDKESAKIFDGMIRYVENRSDAQAAYYIAGDQQVSAGIGHVQIVTEYASERSFDQEIRISPIDDGIAVLWDPDAVQPTREDAAYCFQPVDLTRAAFKERFPDAVPQDFGDTAKIPVEGWVTEDYVRIARYWQKKPVERQLALMPDGTVLDMADEGTAEQAEAANAAAAQQQMPPIRVEKRPGHKITHMLISAGAVLEPEKDWPGSHIPIVPFLGEEIRIGRKVDRRGMIRNAKDAQRAYNYAQTMLIEAVSLQPITPFLVTDDNIKTYSAEWLEANNKPLPYLRYTPDPKNNMAAPQRVQPPVASQGLAEMVAMAGQDLKDTIGIQDAGLGQQGNETSGRAIIARQGESDVGMFTYIDNFSRAVRRVGTILVDLIPKIYDTQRVVRVMGEDGTVEVVNVNQQQIDPATGAMVAYNDLTVGTYDVVVQQGPGYTTRREEAKAGMLEFAKMAPAMFPIMGDLIAKAQDWPLAEEIAERMRTMLPPQILQKEAEKKGEPPPQQQPDPMAEAALAEATAKAEKAAVDVDIAKADLQIKKIEASSKGVELVDKVTKAEPPPEAEAPPQPAPKKAA